MKLEKQQIIVEVLELSDRNPNFQSLINRWRKLKVNINQAVLFTKAEPTFLTGETVTQTPAINTGSL